MKKNFRCKSCNIFNTEAECEHLSKCYKFLNTTIDNIHNLHCEIFTYLSSQPEVIKVSKPNPNCYRSWRGKLADGRSVYLLMSFCILQKRKIKPTGKDMEEKGTPVYCSWKFKSVQSL